MPFLPFLAMTPQYGQPANTLPLPQPKDGMQNTNGLDSNLIAQLEAAQYGQSMTPPPMAMPEISPAQVSTQPQLNRQAQAPVGIPPEPAQMQLSPQDALSQAYGQQQELQNAAIKQAEEQLAAARNKPQQLDISPLLALSQSWSQQPNALLSAYQRPDDQAKNVQALQEAVLKARGGAADISARRAMDVAKLEEAKNTREQRLQEIALKKQEVGALKENRDAQKMAQQQTEWKEKFDKRFGDNITGLAEMAQNAKIAKDLIAKKGRLPVYTDPEWSEYSSAVSSMLTRYNADKAKLGALAGADLRLLERAVGTSTDSLDNLAKNVAGGGAAGSIKVLDKVLKGSDETVNNIGKRAKSVYGDQVMDVYKQSRSFYDESRGLSGGQQEMPKTVTQNGITYTLNPQSGEYE
jgi:hypothetical protein